MKAALKKKWVAALRSGKYKQATSMLRAENGDGSSSYCCLGVLASVAGCRWTKSPSSVSMYPYRIGGRDGNPTLLPDRFALKHGLGRASEDGSIQQRLAGKNDNGWSFKKIATWIEKNL